MTAVAPSSPAAPIPVAPRQGQMAILLQELLTATVRLRLGPQEAPNDIEGFRGQVRRIIAAASDEGRQMGYSEHDIGYALYAAVAFLDETVLTLAHPAFRGWQGKPLQEEIFGVNVGGDVFFQYLDALMKREDSLVLSDVLEVYQLCLLLGFRGRYGGSDSELLQSWTARVRDRIAKIRGTPPPFAPNWAPAGNVVAPAAADPVQRTLLIVIGALVGLSIVLLLVLRLLLRSESRSIGGLLP